MKVCFHPLCKVLHRVPPLGDSVPSTSKHRTGGGSSMTQQKYTAWHKCTDVEEWSKCEESLHDL